MRISDPLSRPAKPATRRWKGNRCRHCGCNDAFPCLLHASRTTWHRKPEPPSKGHVNWKAGCCGNQDCIDKEAKLGNPTP